MRILRSILFFLLISLIQLSCGSGQAPVKDLSANDFKTAIESPAPKQLIDVRTDAEVSQGRIANARQIDFASPAFEQQLDQLDKNQPVYLYCAIGGRSTQAAQICARKGFKEVYNLSGGIQGWMQAGNPISQ